MSVVVYPNPVLKNSAELFNIHKPVELHEFISDCGQYHLLTPERSKSEVDSRLRA